MSVLNYPSRPTSSQFASSHPTSNILDDEPIDLLHDEAQYHGSQIHHSSAIHRASERITGDIDDDDDNDDDDDDDDDEGHNCRRCDLPISEGHAYELGGDRWHMYCFSCSKCSKLLGTSSNFLVLGTGDLICSDCSYACNSCGKKIDDLAILTGDQAYCSTCFCCRNCKKRIEDLRYARTSKGLFCMSCHEKLLEKKRKHEKLKQQQQQQQQQHFQQSNRNSKISNFDKLLPSLPSHGRSSESNDELHPNRVMSPISIGSDISTPGIVEVESNTATTITASTSTPAIPPRSPNRVLQSPSKPIQEITHQTLEPPVTVSPNHNHTSSPKEDPVKTPQESSPRGTFTENHLKPSTPTKSRSTSPLRANIMKTPLADSNRQAVVVDSLSSSSSNNFLSSYITSHSPEKHSPPPNVPLPKAPSPSLSAIESAGENFLDMNDSGEDDERFNTRIEDYDNENNDINDYANINDDSATFTRDETIDYNTKNISEEISKYDNKPSGLGEFRKSKNVPAGLNIQGVGFNDTLDPEKRQTASNEDSQPIIKTPSKQKSPWRFGGGGSSKSENNENVLVSPSPNKKTGFLESGISKSKSIRSPKNFLNFSRGAKTHHQKSESASSIDYKISSPVLTESNRFVSKNDRYNTSISTPKLKPTNNLDAITSPYQGAALFTTPPIPDSQFIISNNYNNKTSSATAGHSRTQSHQRSVSSGSHHIRSRSDANNNTQFDVELKQSELELRSLKIEIRDLKQTKNSILKEIQDLNNIKFKLNNEIEQLNTKAENSKLKVDSNTSVSSIDRSISSTPGLNESLQSTSLSQQQSQSQPHLHSQLKSQSQSTPQSYRESHSKQPSSSSHILLSEPVIAEQPQQQTQAQTQSTTQPQQSQQQQQQQTNQNSKSKAPRAKFWKRGNFFNKDATSNGNGIIGSQSSYSLSNILNSDSKNGNPAISAPLLKTEETDELGGNDNKKLISSNGGKYLEVGNSSIASNGGGNASSNSSNSNLLDGNNITNGNAANGNNSNNFIMSDLFNSTLESRAIFEKRSIPLIVTRSIEEVERRGLDSEGIYRKNGSTSQMNLILKAFNNLYQSETSKELENVLNSSDINAITSSLKKYFYHHLPEPLITNQIYEDFIKVSEINDTNDKIQRLSLILNRLPKTNLKTLDLLLSHFEKISKLEHLNKMNYHNLSVIFGPTFTRISNSERELKDMKTRNQTVEFLMICYNQIFENIVIN